MKQLTILLLALTTNVTGLAQSKIEKLFCDIDTKADITKTTSHHYKDDGKKPTTFCYYDEITMTKANFGKLDERIARTFADETDAYSLYIKPQGRVGAENPPISIPYGTRNEYSVKFGSHESHNYYVGLFRDRADSTKRHAYAIVWYTKNDDVKVLKYHIYGNDPKKVQNNRTITVNGNQIIDTNGYVVTGLDKMEPTINNDIDFMKRFGTLRASLTTTHAGSTLVRSGIVVKIVELCKKHHSLLSDNERATCIKSLDELIKNHSHNDPYIKGMLEEARIALK